MSRTVAEHAIVNVFVNANLQKDCKSDEHGQQLLRTWTFSWVLASARIEGAAIAAIARAQTLPVPKHILGLLRCAIRRASILVNQPPRQHVPRHTPPEFVLGSARCRRLHVTAELTLGDKSLPPPTFNLRPLHPLGPATLPLRGAISLSPPRDRAWRARVFFFS